MENPMQVVQERRNHRSTVMEEALTLQLEASARRSGLDYMVLSDHQGLIIARSKDVSEAEEVAAFGPFLAERKTWTGRLPCESGPRDATISPFQVAGQNVFLCAVGMQSKHLAGEIVAAQSGVLRIIGD